MMTPINKKILTKEEFDFQDRLMQETSLFAFEILQLKKEKAQIVDELKERGRELQRCCRKIAAKGGKATMKGDNKLYVVKGSFDPDLFNPEIGNFDIKKVHKSQSFNDALADEIDKIYKLTYGYYGTKLTQLFSQFEMTCKKFWVLDESTPVKEKS